MLCSVLVSLITGRFVCQDKALVMLMESSVKSERHNASASSLRSPVYIRR